MARPHTSARTRFAALCWVVGACSCTDLASRHDLSPGFGGQSGDGSGNHGGQTGDGAGIAKVGAECPRGSTEWEGGLDERVPGLDVTPEQVIARVEGSIEDTFGWISNERVATTGTATRVKIELTYQGGAIAVRKPNFAPTDGRQEASDLAPTGGYVSRAAEYCDTLLALEFEATLETNDGALDETFPVLVTANQQGAAHFEGWLPSKLSGSLATPISNAQGRLYVAAMLTAWGNSGELVFIRDGNDEDGEVAASERIARWPFIDASACEDSGYGRVLAAVVPIAKGGTLGELFDGLVPSEAPLRWTTTPAWPYACSPETLEEAACNTTLYIETSAVSELWCVTMSPFDPSFSALGSVEVGLRTADDKWRGSYDARAHLSGQPGSVSGVGITVIKQSVATSGEALGFSSVELVPGSEASLIADVFNERGVMFGSLGVAGHAVPVDSDGVPSTVEPSPLMIHAGIGATR